MPETYENDWFTYEDVESEADWGYGTFHFRACTLTHDLGRFPEGSRFERITVGLEVGSGEITLDTDEGEPVTYSLRVTVGDPLICLAILPFTESA